MFPGLPLKFSDPRVPVVTVALEIRERDAGGSTMIVKSIFATDAEIEAMVANGSDRGMATSVGQADALYEGAVSGMVLWGTEWGTKPHVAQPISAKLDFARTA